MQRLILALAGILLLGSTGAFFLYVSTVSILSVAVLLMALMLMFLLGLQSARLPNPIPVVSWRRGLHVLAKH